MLDIQLFRENPELIKENLKKKFQDKKIVMVDEIRELDQEYRELKTRADFLRGQRNSLSKEIGTLMRDKKIEEANETKEKVQAFANELKEIEEQEEPLLNKIQNMMKNIPNIIADDVPLGKDDSENVELYRVGNYEEKSFDIPYHVDIMECQ